MFSNLFVNLLKESIHLYEDRDLYMLYRTYNQKKHQAFIDGNTEDYKKLTDVSNMLKKEILKRCC